MEYLKYMVMFLSGKPHGKSNGHLLEFWNFVNSKS